MSSINFILVIVFSATILFLLDVTSTYAESYDGIIYPIESCSDKLTKDLIILQQNTDKIMLIDNQSGCLDKALSHLSENTVFLKTSLTYDYSQNQKIISDIIPIINDNPVEYLILGESLVYHGYDITNMQNHVTETKKSLLETKVSTREPIEIWLDYSNHHQSFYDTVDFVFYDDYQFWLGKDITESLENIVTNYDSISQKFPDLEVYVETSWPKDGPIRKNAIPSAYNQELFMKQLNQQKIPIHEKIDSSTTPSHQLQYFTQGFFLDNPVPKKTVDVMIDNPAFSDVISVTFEDIEHAQKFIHKVQQENSKFDLTGITINETVFSSVQSSELSVANYDVSDVAQKKKELSDDRVDRIQYVSDYSYQDDVDDTVNQNKIDTVPPSKIQFIGITELMNYSSFEQTTFPDFSTLENSDLSDHDTGISPFVPDSSEFIPVSPSKLLPNTMHPKTMEMSTTSPITELISDKKPAIVYNQTIPLFFAGSIILASGSSKMLYSIMAGFYRVLGYLISSGSSLSVARHYRVCSLFNKSFTAMGIGLLVMAAGDITYYFMVENENPIATHVLSVFLITFFGLLSYNMITMIQKNAYCKVHKETTALLVILPLLLVFLYVYSSDTVNMLSLTVMAGLFGIGSLASYTTLSYKNSKLEHTWIGLTTGLMFIIGGTALNMHNIKEFLLFEIINLGDILVVSGSIVTSLVLLLHFKTIYEIPKNH